jgi:hypothetical protein
VIVLLILFSFCTAPISSFADSATMNMLAGQTDQYGRVRIGGTFGWGIFALVAGIAVQAYGLQVAFWGYAALMLLALLVCQRFVFGSAAPDASLRGGVRTLMANRHWVLFLVLAFVSGVGFAAINTYLFAYMQELNASKTTMGLALTVSTLAELPVLFYADRLLSASRRAVCLCWRSSSPASVCCSTRLSASRPAFWSSKSSTVSPSPPRGWRGSRTPIKTRPQA